MNRFLSGDGSTQNVEAQEACMRAAAIAGFSAGVKALLVSSVVILGAAKAFPRFNRSLSVSSKTALIASPMFASFALMGELELNDCARKARQLRRSAEAARKAAGGNTAASSS